MEVEVGSDAVVEGRAGLHLVHHAPRVVLLSGGRVHRLSRLGFSLNFVTRHCRSSGGWFQRGSRVPVTSAAARKFESPMGWRRHLRCAC